MLPTLSETGSRRLGGLQPEETEKQERSMRVEATSQSLTAVVGDPTVGGLPEWKLRRVVNYIEQNLPRELRLAEVSAVIHMSPYHFAHLFKERTGVSPYRFVLQQRVEEARTLLAVPTLPIAVVARSVGFRTPSHFSTTFRRITGFTPSGYRRKGEAKPGGAMDPACRILRKSTRG